MDKQHEQQQGEGQDAQGAHLIPQRNLGPGVTVDLAIADHGLRKTCEFLFGRLDFELERIVKALPLPPSYRRQTLDGLTELLTTAQADLDRAAAELPQGSVAVQHQVIPVIVHTPYAGQFLEVVRAGDRVLTALHAAWILGQLPEENFEASSRQVRGQLHQLAGAVDALFRACLGKTRPRPRNGNGAGGDGNVGARGGEK